MDDKNSNSNSNESVPHHTLVGRWSGIRHILHTHWRMDTSFAYVRDLMCVDMPLEKWICQLCNLKVKFDEYYVCGYLFFEIIGRQRCLFAEGFGTLCKVMKYEVLWELKRCYETLLKGNNTTIQRTITSIFSLITNTDARSRLRPCGPQSHHPCHHQ